MHLSQSCLMHRSQPCLMHLTQPCLMHLTQPCLMQLSLPCLMHLSQPCLMHRSQPCLMHRGKIARVKPFYSKLLFFSCRVGNGFGLWGDVDTLESWQFFILNYPWGDSGTRKIRLQTIGVIVEWWKQKARQRSSRLFSVWGAKFCSIPCRASCFVLAEFERNRWIFP